jgi:hypothetical protein
MRTWVADLGNRAGGGIDSGVDTVCLVQGPVVSREQGTQMVTWWHSYCWYALVWQHTCQLGASCSADLGHHSSAPAPLVSLL